MWWHISRLCPCRVNPMERDLCNALGTRLRKVDSQHKYIYNSNQCHTQFPSFEFLYVGLAKRDDHDSIKPIHINDAAAHIRFVRGASRKSPYRIPRSFYLRGGFSTIPSISAIATAPLQWVSALLHALSRAKLPQVISHAAQLSRANQAVGWLKGSDSRRRAIRCVSI